MHQHTKISFFLSSLLLLGCSGDSPDLTSENASITLAITDAPLTMPMPLS